MIRIYHNNRCSKSRETLSLLQSKTSEIQIIEYVKNPIKFEDVKLIIEKLKIKPIQLIRKNEKIWKTLYKKKHMKDKEIIEAIVIHPKLMQRPIVITNKKAIIGRPPENVLDLFD